MAMSGRRRLSAMKAAAPTTVYAASETSSLRSAAPASSGKVSWVYSAAPEATSRA